MIIHEIATRNVNFNECAGSRITLSFHTHQYPIKWFNLLLPRQKLGLPKMITNVRTKAKFIAFKRSQLVEPLSLLSGSVFWSRFLHEIRKHIWRLFEINVNCCKWNTILAFEKVCKFRKNVLITYLLFYEIFYNWNIGS